ncbi:MAG TPA: TonB-dependent receptor plug domain-containing protein, partial [Anseongella sp.]|nr:TonB-dependent receptor plug domain-containing protein [Anseongella sp.]
MNKNRLRLPFILAGIFLSASSAAQEKQLTLDQVVVTATKFDKKSSETGKVVRVIRLDELERFQGRSLIDVLNDQAGLVINNAYGPMGSNTSYYLRGAEAKYTSIQIDGIPVADPAGFSTFFDLNNLSLDQVERIEILRGANSTLHGSGAVAGVINIITKKGGSKPVSFNGVLSGGSYNTYRGNGNVSGSLSEGLFDYNVGYTLTDSEGFSSAMQPDTSAETFDKDGFSQHALNANFAVRPAKGLALKPFFRYTQNEYGFDGQAFTDRPYRGDNRFLQTGLGLVNYLDDRGQWIVSYAFSDFDRKSNDHPDPEAPLSHFQGLQHNAETYLNYRISRSFHFIAGMDFNALHSDVSTPYGGISSDSANMNYGSVYGSVFFSSPSGFN